MRRITPNFVENNERNTAIWSEMMVGGMGFDVINDTAYHAGNYFKIIPLTTSTQLTSATYFQGYSAQGLEKVILPQGVSIFGDFTSLTLATGAVIAYYMY